jgi:hypothetical protein
MAVESITAFNKTELGAPIPIYFVSLREIRSFEHGSDPNALLKVREKFLYPVKLGDLIVSSMVIQETKKGWKATNLGDINLAKRVTKLISDGVTANRIDASRYFLTEIPALSLLFVTHRTDGGLVLQSVSDIEDIDVKAAVEEPAEKIFEALKPFSQGSYLSPS